MRISDIMIGKMGQSSIASRIADKLYVDSMDKGMLQRIRNNGCLHFTDLVVDVDDF